MIDVAQSLGVSRATVSLAMRNSPLLSETTRSQVLAEAARLGYVYNQGAANLRTQRNMMVALVMPDVVNPFVAEVSLGAQEVLSERGYFMVINNTTDRADVQGWVLRSLAEQRVSGVIIIPALGSTADDFAAIADQHLPTVLLYRRLPTVELPFVGTADDRIGTLGATHLIVDHSCDGVAYFGAVPAASPRLVREKAFRRLAEQHQVTVVEEWSRPFDAGMIDAYRRANDLLDRGRPPRGVLCHNDQVAYGLLKSLSSRGYGPDDCVVVGIDDLASSQMWSPSVSSIAVDPFNVGRVSARTLLDRMHAIASDEAKDPAVQGSRDLPEPILRARASCGCNPDPHPEPET